MATVIEVGIDLDPCARAKAALAQSPIWVLREIRVEQVGDTLLLQGRVDTFYHKQLAQELVRMVADGLRVENELVVD
jgi:hypothetical protein